MQIQDQVLKNLFPQAEFIQNDYQSWLEQNKTRELEPYVDSRQIDKPAIFFALTGALTDGHQFLQDAIKRGASILVVDNKNKSLIDVLPIKMKQKALFLFVDDVDKSLVDAARIWRSLFSIPVIGITGSMGKSTVKEIIGHVFRKVGYEILIPLASYNSLIGVSLTALRLEKKHQLALFEMGINASGEMDDLVEVVQPAAGIITTVAHAHTEGLHNLQTIVYEKEKIFSRMPDDTIKIVGEKVLPFLSEKLKKQVKRVGSSFESDVWLDGNRLHCYGESILCDHDEIHAGRLYNRIVAIAFVVSFGVSLQDAVEHAFSWESMPGRFEKKQISGRESYIINDACNANPESMIVACKTFDEMRVDHPKIIILGPMYELGLYADQGHRLVLESVSRSDSVSICILIGYEFQLENVSLSKKIKYIFVKDAKEAELFLIQFLQKKEATVLLKSSKVVGLAKIADKLCR